MNHAVHAAAGLTHCFQIRDAVFYYFNFSIYVGQVCDFTGGEIVQRHNLVAAPHEFVDRIRADESGSAGYQIAHFFSRFEIRYQSGAENLK
jgi:hypothetical protein